LRQRIAIARRRLGEAETRPDEIAIDADRSLAGLQVAVEGRHGAAVVDDVEEAGIDIEGLALGRYVSAYARQPAIGGGIELPPVNFSIVGLRPA
jgi:hypothetical protein